MYADSTPSSGLDVEEFCPRMDEANMRILNQIGDHADDTGIYSLPKSASAGGDSDSDNELLPSNTVIPDPEEVDAAVHDAEEFLIAPDHLPKVLTQSAEYKRKHFSNTSSESSDSDDSITRGLDFKNIPVTATIEPHSSPSSSLLSNIQHSLGRNLIDNILRPSTQSSQSKAYDSEDEISDFEMLDTDDLMK